MAVAYKPIIVTTRNTYGVYIYVIPCVTILSNFSVCYSVKLATLDTFAAEPVQWGEKRMHLFAFILVAALYNTQ